MSWPPRHLVDEPTHVPEAFRIRKAPCLEAHVTFDVFQVGMIPDIGKHCRPAKCLASSIPLDEPSETDLKANLCHHGLIAHLAEVSFDH